MEKDRELRIRSTRLQLIFDKGGKVIKWRKIIFSISGTEINWAFTCRKMNLYIDLSPFAKINSKWITDLNVKCKTIKLLKDNKILGKLMPVQTQHQRHDP